MRLHGATGAPALVSGGHLAATCHIPRELDDFLLLWLKIDDLNSPITIYKSMAFAHSLDWCIYLTVLLLCQIFILHLLSYVAASMARKIYLRGGIGVGAFRRIYGGSKRNGSRPPHFCKSSGSVARHILQQLQEMSIIEMDPRGGRMITSSGRRDLDQVAGRIAVVAS
ncbi:40S ribosomal protein S19-1-like [Olea europaea var. sylvestris]|uniref:40S ribosomal protein S19-1-like n=1 Tax=Olea europaea var. sylvestris TaxID=158386 RepID=UPI000C1CF3FA|nr:40S ribosomal protein S19-1-like [Olea europaea var. sylvestris]